MIEYCEDLSKKYGFISAITPYTLRMAAQQFKISESLKVQDL